MARYLAIGSALVLSALVLVPTAFGWRRIDDKAGIDTVTTCVDGVRGYVGNTPVPELKVVASSPARVMQGDPDTTIATWDLGLKDSPVLADDGGGVFVEVPYTGGFARRWSQPLTAGASVSYELLQPGEEAGKLEAVEASTVGSCNLFGAPVPPGDGFGAATVLSGPVAFVGGEQNGGATKQAGEPQHAGDAGGHSVWYRWTAPVTGVARVNTCGSDFDTVLGVYTGSAVNALTGLAADDDGCGQLDGSRLRFTAQKGSTYRIAVDGFGGDVGTFNLALELSPGAATFGPPFDLSDPKQGAADQRVAIDADGDAVFVWRRFDGSNVRVQTRTMTAAGNLSPVQTLSSGGKDANAPSVAVDADGDAVFTWFRFDGTNLRVQARARSATGVLSGVQNLSDPGQSAFDPDVAIDPNGNAVFTWPRFDGSVFRIQARTRSASGVLGPVRDLSRPGQETFNPADHTPRPRVAVDGDGDAVFIWGFFDGSNSRIQARALFGGALTPRQTLSSDGQNAVEPRVAVDQDGDAVFMWLRSNGVTNVAQTRARSAAGVLGGVQTLSETTSFNAVEPQVAVDPDGDAVLVWRRHGGAFDTIQARTRSSAGVLSGLLNVSASGQNAVAPQVAMDAAGDAVMTWQRVDHGTQPADTVFVVQARERTAAGSLLAVQTLTDAEQTAFRPEIAVAPDGEAAVAFGVLDGSLERIQGAIRP